MEIIYRVYEITEEEVESWNGNKYIEKSKVMLDQTILCCETREQFKAIMRDMYKPKEVHFANTRKLVNGDIYINIISEDCYNTAEYFILNDYTCSCCGRNFKTNNRLLIKFYSTWAIRNACEEKYLKNEIEIANMVFCTNSCRNIKENQLIDEYKEYARANNLIEDNTWISRDTFSKYDYGYIYQITKKSTGEFYVGKTKYVPIFRWGQHLTTERFKLENIEDYKFEILEVLKKSSDKKLSEREAYWINKKRNENPKLSLNVQIPQENNQMSIFDIEE